MTGNVTDLATSKRLTKAGWTRGLMNMGDERYWFWVLRDSQWSCVYSDNCGVGDNSDGWFDARSLSELEAKAAEMKTQWHATSLDGTVWVTLWEKGGGDLIGQGKAEHFINTLGAAVAEALEAVAKESKR